AGPSADVGGVGGAVGAASGGGVIVPGPACGEANLDHHRTAQAMALGARRAERTELFRWLLFRRPFAHRRIHPVCGLTALDPYGLDRISSDTARGDGDATTSQTERGNLIGLRPGAEWRGARGR